MEHISDKLIEKLDDSPSRQRQRHFKPDWRDSHRHDVYYKRSENWVRSKIGQHFDKVFSAWCDLKWVPIDKRNMKGIEMVLEKTVMVGGILCAQNFWGGLEENWAGIYVHPKTKIISYKKRKSGIGWQERQKRETAKICRILDDYHQIFKLEGIWYDVVVAPTFERRNHKFVDGIFVAQPPTIVQSRKRIPYDAFGYRECGKVTRRQLSKAELKQYGVTNDPVQY